MTGARTTNNRESIDIIDNSLILLRFVFTIPFTPPKLNKKNDRTPGPGIKLFINTHQKTIFKTHAETRHKIIKHQS